MYQGRAIFTERFHAFVERAATIGLGVATVLSITVACLVVIGG